LFSQDDIIQFIDLVAEVVDPDRIILFGSYAYGQPTDKSDLDLLVIKNGKDLSIDDEAKLDTAVYLKKKQLNIQIRYDAFFLTDQQVERSVVNGGAFIAAIQKGKVVYERSTKKECGLIL
jgi:predicted nucleotidyltransferase